MIRYGSIDGAVIQLSNTTIAELDTIRVQTSNTVPAFITRRQFAQQLFLDGLITGEEAISWASNGQLPAQIINSINSLITDETANTLAKILASGANSFERHHALTEQLGTFMGYDSTELDDLWRSASIL